MEDVSGIKGTDGPDYALRLGDGLDSVTHNRFVVPDWGALRFDLFTGDVPENESSGELSVYLDVVGSTPSDTPLQTIYLQEAVGTATSYADDL